MRPMEWYMEYEIHHDRPGLLGDVATFLGLMGVNIVMINGITNRKRGLLLKCSDAARMVTLKNALNRASNIELTALRRPNFIDLINLDMEKSSSGSGSSQSFVCPGRIRNVGGFWERSSQTRPVIGPGMPG